MWNQLFATVQAKSISVASDMAQIFCDPGQDTHLEDHQQTIQSFLRGKSMKILFISRRKNCPKRNLSHSLL
jgi:hypothetical protein